jgi:hypothetical protein
MSNGSVNPKLKLLAAFNLDVGDKARWPGYGNTSEKVSGGQLREANSVASRNCADFIEKSERQSSFVGLGVSSLTSFASATASLVNS